MLVKTVREHLNSFGRNYAKRVGDTYDHPAPETDIRFGYIEPVKARRPRKPRRAKPAAPPPAQPASGE